MMGEQKKDIINSPLIFTCNMLLCAVGCVSVFFAEANYYIAFIIPLSAMVAAFVVYFKKLFSGFGTLFFFEMYMFRYTVVLAISAFANFYADLPIDLVNGKFVQACVLMAYELLCLVAAMSIMAAKEHKSKDKGTRKQHSYNRGVFKGFIIVLLCFVLVCLISYPQLRYNFKSFFLSNDELVRRYENYQEAQRTVPGVIFYTFVYVTELFRIAVYIYFLSKIGKNNKFIVAFIELVVLTLVFLLCGTHVQIIPFILFISGFIYLASTMKVKPKYIILTVFALAIIMVAAMSVYSSADNIDRLSRAMQNYFNGVSTTSGALNIQRSPSSILYFLFDTLYSNSFIQGFFDFDLNSMGIHLDTIRDTGRSSIFPFIAQSRFYFGYIFAPILSIIAYLVVARFDKMIARREAPQWFNIALYYFVIRLGLVVAMGSASNFVPILLEYYLPLAVVRWISKRGRKKES